MPIDLKSAIALGTRRYIAPTIVVIIFLAGGMSYIWSEYQELLKEKDTLTEERRIFNEERIAFEKYRTDTTIEYHTKKNELEQRELIAQQLEQDNSQRLESLKKTAEEYKLAIGELQQEQETVSESRRVREAEKEISKLMSEFSAIGVDLNESIKCSDSELRTRFNSAKAKYTEIYSLAQAYGLTERYKSFFFHNAQHTYSPCSG